MEKSDSEEENEQHIWIILIGTNFLLDTSFKTSPTFLSAKGFKASIDTIFHHGYEFLVAQHSISIIIKYLKTKLFLLFPQD